MSRGSGGLAVLLSSLLGESVSVGKRRRRRDNVTALREGERGKDRRHRLRSWILNELLACMAATWRLQHMARLACPFTLVQQEMGAENRFRRSHVAVQSAWASIRRAAAREQRKSVSPLSRCRREGTTALRNGGRGKSRRSLLRSWILDELVACMAATC